MKDTNICRDFLSGLDGLFACSEHGEYHRIRTPYLYPDGDYIDVFCKRDGDTVIVSDLAETTGWLWLQSAAARRSPRQNRLIDEICMTHGVEFCDGMLQSRQRRGERLAEVVIRVAQAALRTSDIYFTFRRRSADSAPIEEKVAACLRDHRLNFDRRRKFAGVSGRSWDVDFLVGAPEYRSLVFVLSAKSKSSSHSVVEHVFTAWCDLKPSLEKGDAQNFVSLLDDTVDVWEGGDFRLVESVSTVARWARPERFIEALSHG